MLPRDIECPFCHAEIGQGCWTSGMRPRSNVHVARWLAIGIDEPTDEQLWDNYQDQIERDNEIRKRVFKEMRERLSSETVLH